MPLLPAILAEDKNDFHEKLFSLALHNEAPMFHIDVLDGSMFGATSFSDADVVGAWHDLPQIELHLMVENPLPIVEAWREKVPSTKRAIVHAEIGRPIGSILERIVNLGLEPGLALNPETPVELFEKHASLLKIGLIMGVHPGQSGQAFLGEPILAKIRRAHLLLPRLTLAVDGGVTLRNALSLIQAGASILVASSAIWSAKNPRESSCAFQALLHE